MMAVVSRLWLMSLQGCVLILIVLLARLLLKKYPKILSYSLWALVGIRLLCPVFIESSVSLQPDFSRLQNNWENPRQETTEKTLPVQIAPEVTGNQETEPWAEELQSVPYEKTEENANVIMELEEIIQSSNAKKKVFSASNIKELLAAVYLTGAIVMTAGYFVRNLIVKRKLRTAIKKEEGIWLCDRVQSPFVIGIVQPRIILPYGLKEEEEYYILLHERTHIRHRDSLIRSIGIICLCLHWWNPLVWLAVHYMNKDMEMFCDEAALEQANSNERKAYAETLLNFAIRRSGFSVGLAFGESNAEQRIKNIVKSKKRSRIIFAVVMTAAVLGSVVFLTIPRTKAKEALKTEETIATLTVTPATTEQPEVTSGAEPIPTLPIEKKQAHKFNKYDVLTEYEVPQYSIEFLLKNGTVRTLLGDAPGTGECVWYFVEYHGVMYYLYRLAGESEEKLQLSAFAYVDKQYALENHLQVGWTKEKVLLWYPDMAIVPIKGEAYEEDQAWNLGFNSGAFPSSIAGQDADFNYGDKNIWFWQEQFDYCMLAEIEGETKLGRTMALALMMKEDKVAAITFYCPNDGFVTPEEWNLEISAMGDFEWPDETFFKVNSNLLDGKPVKSSEEEKMLKEYQDILFDLLYECKLPDDSESEVVYPITLDRFTICDVDFDGKDELMILHSATYSAQTRTYILEYRPETGTLYEEAVIYPGFRLFENGILTAVSLYNHSNAAREGRALWPYSLYQYDAENDTYEFLFEISAWDKYYHPAHFPEDADKDGDGMVYRFTADGIWQDGAAYEAWFAETFGNLKEGDMSWKNLTEEDISALMKN